MSNIEVKEYENPWKKRKEPGIFQANEVLYGYIGYVMITSIYHMLITAARYFSSYLINITKITLIKRSL